MAKRRKRIEHEPVETADYTDADGNVLRLRCSLSAGTIRKLSSRQGKAAASVEDEYTRRAELLFEHLAVSWEIAGLPLDDQKLLLGRYRMADAETRRWIARTIATHVERHIPALASG